MFRSFKMAILPALLAMAGCANITTTQPGTPLVEVEAKFGKPTISCPLSNGGQRVVWSSQPMGQYAWGTRTTPDGRVGKIDQILTDEHFRMLDQGTWTAEQVLCEFGPPADKGMVGMSSVAQMVWSYRYRQESVFNSLMYVYLGKDGKQVTRHHPGPDPLFDPDKGYWGAGVFR